MSTRFSFTALSALFYRSVVAGCLLGLAVGALAAPGFLLVANRGSNPGVVTRANLDGTGGAAVAIGSLAQNPTFVAVDLTHGRMYMTNHGNPSVVSSYLDGTGAVNLGDLGGFLGVGFGDPYGIALDVAADKMYVVVRGLDILVRANLDGTGATQVNLTGTGVALNGPYGIAIDPAAGKLYVVNMGSNEIIKANLDGSAAVKLALGGLLTSPTDIALDAVGGNMYVVNIATGGVVRAGLDGSSPVSLGTFGGLLTTAYGIALDRAGGKLYVTNIAGTVAQASLDGTGGVSLGDLSGTLSSPVGVAVVPVLHCSFDFDGNGSADALTDGLMLVRAMFGLTGTAVTSGAVGSGATRTAWSTIQPYLNLHCGGSFAP